MPKRNAGKCTTLQTSIKSSAATNEESDRVAQDKRELVGHAQAHVLAGPFATNAAVVKRLQQNLGNDDISLSDYVGSAIKEAKKVNANNLAEIENYLFSQAISLNAWFAELSRRTVKLLDGGAQYSEATEMYFKMAMKAQNQARMTLETLAKVKNPPKVFAEQANINLSGNQQVNNHAHGPKTENSPSKLIEDTNETPMDRGATGSKGKTDSCLEAMVAVDRPQNN